MATADPQSIYFMTGPTSWGPAPEFFSFTSLSKLEQCPLHWHLIHSDYGELSRFPARPNAKAAEGAIIHQAISKIIRALIAAGAPDQGSAKYRETLAEVRPRHLVADLVEEHERRVAAHPRGGGAKLHVTTQSLINKVIRLLGEEYPKIRSTHSQPSPTAASPLTLAPGETGGSSIDPLQLLKTKGALTELPLAHPTIPFKGTLDLVILDRGEPVITDFKTGSPSPEHIEQLILYAILWWRSTQTVPAFVEARYLSAVERVPVDESLLATAESELTDRVRHVTKHFEDPPAPARTGPRCEYCDVRQFCDEYWPTYGAALPSKKKLSALGAPAVVDIELSVAGTPTAAGFDALDLKGESLLVVFPQNALKVHGPFVEGESLRILRGCLTEKGSTVELKPWTEVFHRG